MPQPRDSQSLDLPLLPRELFWMVLDSLGGSDIVRCRRVSRLWNEAFGDPANLIPLLKKLFPLAAEVRELYASHDYNLLAETNDSSYWRALFDRIASRYEHLGRGKPKSIRRHRLCEELGVSGEREWFQVQPWSNFIIRSERTLTCVTSKGLPFAIFSK